VDELADSVASQGKADLGAQHRPGAVVPVRVGTSQTAIATFLIDYTLDDFATHRRPRRSLERILGPSGAGVAEIIQLPARQLETALRLGVFLRGPERIRTADFTRASSARGVYGCFRQRPLRTI
jgi:hypothetical protein